MLAEARRAAAPRHRLVFAVQRVVVAGVLERPGLRVVDGLEEATVREVLVLEQVRDGVDRPAEHPEPLRDVADLLLRPLGHPRQQVLLELLDPLGLRALVERPPLLGLEEVLAAHHAQRAVEPVGAAAHEVIAVLARERAGGHGPPERHPTEHAPAVLVPRQPRQPHVDGVRRGLVDADVQVLAVPGRLSGAERNRGRERRAVPGVVERDAARRLERVVLGVARAGHRPAQGVQREVDSLEVAIRPRLTEVCDRGHDELRLYLAQHVVAEAEAFHDTRPVVLDEHVGRRDEVEQPLAALLGAQVEDDAALVGVEEQEHPRAVEAGDVAEEGWQRPRGVAAGSLHLDHLGAGVGEDARAERACRVLRQVDHAHVVQWHRCGHLAPRGILRGRPSARFAGCPTGTRTRSWIATIGGA